MTHRNEKTFLADICQQLDEDIARMDELTVARLAAARQQALAANPVTRRLPLVAGFALAASLFLLVMLLVDPPAVSPSNITSNYLIHRHRDLMRRLLRGRRWITLKR